MNTSFNDNEQEQSKKEPINLSFIEMTCKALLLINIVVALVLSITEYSSFASYLGRNLNSSEIMSILYNILKPILICDMPMILISGVTLAFCRIRKKYVNSNIYIVSFSVGCILLILLGAVYFILSLVA